MRPYREIPSGFDPDPPELAITSIEGDDRPVYADAAKLWGECSQASYWRVGVSAAGNLSGSLSDSRHVAGIGSGAAMSSTDFQQIQLLLDQLPGDDGSLPPPGHKLVVTVVRLGAATVRVYDRANLPDAVLTILRLTKARMQVLTPMFTPAKVWPPEEARSLALPPRESKTPWRGTVSPDGSIRVEHDFVHHTMTVYEAESDKELRVIHEFWQNGQANGGGYVTLTNFSPDGRHLLVRWGKQEGAVLYDTRTWQVVRDLKLFPQELIDYQPSSDWHLGLAITTKGESLVWDQDNHRILSKLDGLSDVQSTAFSQDGTRLAVYSGPNNIFKLHLTIWDVRGGQMTRELWPVEWASYPAGKPIWWNGGRWLLATWQGQYGGGGMGLWDATTGRFNGTLALPDCQTNGVLPVPRESLLQQCYTNSGAEDTVREWTVEGVQKQIEPTNPK